jgi:uncharacterized OsmC-like protein
MAENHGFTIRLEQRKDFEYNVKFDWPEVPDLLTDEPEPLGGQKGPNASRMVAVAVANCLCASLWFCLKRSKNEPGGVKAEVTGNVARNEQKRLRISDFAVRIELSGVEDPSKLERCLGLFEDYCVVTASIRQGIPVSVEVYDDTGTKLM